MKSTSKRIFSLQVALLFIPFLSNSQAFFQYKSRPTGSINAQFLEINKRNGSFALLGASQATSSFVHYFHEIAADGSLQRSFTAARSLSLSPTTACGTNDYISFSRNPSGITQYIINKIDSSGQLAVAKQFSVFNTQLINLNLTRLLSLDSTYLASFDNVISFGLIRFQTDLAQVEIFHFDDLDTLQYFYTIDLINGSGGSRYLLLRNTFSSLNPARLLIKFDSLLNIVWAKNISLSGTINPIQLVEKSDGSLLVLADRSGFNWRYPIVISVDTSGTVQWARSYQTTPSISLIPKDIIEQQNKNITFLAGSSFLFTIDSIGNPLWAKKLEIPFNQIELFGLLQKPDSELLFVGSNRQNGYFNADALVFNLDSAGNGMCADSSVSFTGNVETCFSQPYTTLYPLNVYTIPTNSIPAAYLADSVRYTVCSAVSLPEVSSNEIRLYPIPASSFLHFSALPVNLKSIQVYTSTGQLFEQYSTQNWTDFQLSVADWPEGLYTLILLGGDSPRPQKFIISH